jgi:hypothetical protein
MDIKVNLLLYLTGKGTSSMKSALPSLLLLLLSGCSLLQESATPPASSVSYQADANGCIGTTDLPPSLSKQFIKVDDDALLQQALGEPDKGGLCKGQVYQATGDVTLYRAWNSTNPNSQMGSWWAFYRPSGLIAQYRADYEICYQWSPLDKMVNCTLKTGTRVVVGNGQSAMCSQYLNYPASAAQQVFISNATESVSDCENFDAVFQWR